MTLSDFATFSTAISGIAVTASLIYLALQTHQNTKHTKALIQQGWTDRLSTTFLKLADTDLMTCWLEGNGEVATAESVKHEKFLVQCEVHMHNFEELFSQHCDGLISEDRFASRLVAIEKMLRQPGFRAFWIDWKAARPRQAQKFIAFFDEIASQATAVGPSMTTSVR